MMYDTKVQMKLVKLIGGPMGGREVSVPRDADSFAVGKRPKPYWTYSFAGRKERQELFAIDPPSRKARQLIRWYVGKYGKDPRVESDVTKQKPIRRGDARHPVS
jgi:hypothetical protein